MMIFSIVVVVVEIKIMIIILIIIMRWCICLCASVFTHPQRRYVLPYFQSDPICLCIKYKVNEPQCTPADVL